MFSVLVCNRSCRRSIHWAKRLGPNYPMVHETTAIRRLSICTQLIKLY